MILKFIYSLIICLSITFVVIESRKDCVGRQGKSTTYCVCNATYCDDLDAIVKKPSGSVQLFQTNQNGDRHKEVKVQFTKDPVPSGDQITLTIDKSKKMQKIIGFGGAFTDAASINIGSLPKELSDNVIKDYFGPTGIEYSLARVPIAGCDFSTRTYTYDDVKDDFELKQFKLTEEDTKYKIPQIQLAEKISQHGIKLFASPWVTPSWLNDKEKLKTEGDKHYQTWANYFIKFLDAYKTNNIDLWGLTMQNEPMSFGSMNFLNATVERDFVKKFLGPALVKAGYTKDKFNLMVYDDGSEKNPIMPYVDTCLDDKEAEKYVNGIAFHCYYGPLNKPDNYIDQVHKKHPNQFILMTECCQQFRLNTNPFTPSTLGDWNEARDYAGNVMNNLHHDVSGWVEWNLALDTFGHPNRDLKMADAPLLIDATAKEYYKNPNFYVLGHYSKYIIRDSVRVDVSTTKTQNDFNFVAFERPDNSTVLVVFNLSDKPINLVINDKDHGNILAKLDSNTIQSYIYWH